MLLGKSYEEACELMGVNPYGYDIPGLISDDIAHAASEALRKFGVKVRPSRLRKIRSLRSARKHALLIIRWKWGGCGEVSESNPWLCHAVIFDADKGEFLDPSGRGYNLKDKAYERQLDSVFYVEPPKAA